MSPNISYYEVGFQTKHVKLAVKIPDLRSSKIKLKKRMKKPRTMMRNRRRRRMERRQADSSSLASFNIDWSQEFEAGGKILWKHEKNSRFGNKYL